MLGTGKSDIIDSGNVNNVMQCNNYRSNGKCGQSHMLLNGHTKVGMQSSPTPGQKNKCKCKCWDSVALVQVSKQPKWAKVLTENAKSHLGRSGQESSKRPSQVIWGVPAKSPQRGFRTSANPRFRRKSLKQSFAPCKRLFWDSHSGGPKTLFALSLSTLAYFGCFHTCARTAEPQCKCI